MFNMKFMPFYTFYSERQLSSNINEAVEIFSPLETQGLVVAAIAWQQQWSRCYIQLVVPTQIVWCFHS